jgi:hypothetical protein
VVKKMGPIYGSGLGESKLQTWLIETEDQFSIPGKNDEEFRRTLTADKRVEVDCEMKADGMEPYFESFRFVFRHQPGGVDHVDGTTFTGMQIHMAQFFFSAIRRAIIGRRFCETGNDRLGLVPRGAEVGDLACVVHGGQSPLLMRPVKKDDGSGLKFKLVGTCYIHGLMDGEAFDLGLPQQDIVLV